MGKNGVRRQSRSSSSPEYKHPGRPDDEDSGFCGSDLPLAKMPKRYQESKSIDDEVMLLKALIKEVNDPDTNYMLPSFEPFQNDHKIRKIGAGYSCKSKNGKYELKILEQPEEQHRYH